MKNSRWGLLLTVGCALAMLAVPVQGGIGAVIARAGRRIERFLVPDHIPGTAPGPLQAKGVEPPTAPQDLHVIGRTGTTLELAWEPSVAGAGRKIDGYELRRNGVPITTLAGTHAAVTINPAGLALESFTVTAIDDQHVSSRASGPVVALRGAPVPLEIQQRTAYVEVETGAGSAEAALAAAAVHIGGLEWGQVYGLGDQNPLLVSPLAASLAVRLYEGGGEEHERQALAEGEYRIRIGPSAPPRPGFPSGPMGDQNAELPVGALVPLRWAEVFLPFEDLSPQVLAVQRTELQIMPDGAATTPYAVSAPDHAGRVVIRMLPNLAEWNARPVAGIEAGSTATGFLAAGQAANLELFDAVGTDYSAAQFLPMVVTVRGPVGVVRILAIDPEVESGQGWDAALADGIEIPSGSEFAAYVSPDGRMAAGRRLVVIGLSPGSVSVGVGLADAPATWEERTITVLPRIELGVDANRDGVLALRRENASDQLAEREPFRFWVNDDDDEGDTDGDDIPLGDLGRADFQNEIVDGARDLVDFFPVFVDLGEALQVLSEGPPVTVRLRQADGAVNFAYTNLTRDHALAHWKELPKMGFGDAFSRPPGAAETHQVTADGVELSPAFLEGIRQQGRGVLLVEGRSPTVAPLTLEVERGGVVVAEARLNLRLSNVEEMFRQVDLTGVAMEYEGGKPALPEKPMPDRTGDPGDAWPDRNIDEKYFVFVHGYAVDAYQARGWQSEMFKRLHVLGSRARFIGVTWHGATGVRIAGNYLDYHKAVFNALQTGDALADGLKDITKGAPVTVAAHSLGNGVVGQAIQYGGFRPEHYIMINAALAMEAYDPSSLTDGVMKDMLELDWMAYNQRLNAANWFKLFLNSEDARRKLTWESRYEQLSQLTDLHHFYSSGEEVLKNAEDVHSPSGFEWLLREHGSFEEGAWKMQELAKGLEFNDSFGALLLSRHQAGWSFEPGWMVSSAGGHNSGINSRRRTPDETKDISAETLKTQPFFGDFEARELTSPDATAASTAAKDSRVLYDLLARAIPAKSYAAAANEIDSIGPRNFNMNTQGRAPDAASLPTPTKQWGHSDLKLLALPLSYRMYFEMIERGALR